MSDRHLRTTASAIVAGLLLVLAGCGDDATSMSGKMGAAATEGSAPAEDPMAGAPAVGSCFRLGQLQAKASTHAAAPVSCYGDHTSLTYHVGLFPEGATYADESRAEKVCAKKLPAAIGIKKNKMLSTILDYEWFEPTAAQWKAGGRWFRCDVVAPFNNKMKKLVPSSTPLYYDGNIDDAYLRCMNSKGSTKEADFVTCDQRHDYRWSGFFTMPDHKKYPTQQQVLDWSRERCKGKVKTENWWVTWPSETTWTGGERWVSCYENTSD